jgi:hypothetical protein
LSKQVVDLREHNDWLYKHLTRMLKEYPHDPFAPEFQAFCERWYPGHKHERGPGSVRTEQRSGAVHARGPASNARNGSAELLIHDTPAGRAHDGAAAGEKQ